MNVLFRVDASILIGSGHVMRCLTLANALSSNNWVCSFICYPHRGNLIKQIEDSGYQVFSSKAFQNEKEVLRVGGSTRYSGWLGQGADDDASLSIDVMRSFERNIAKINWLVVDHYAIDNYWERKLLLFVDNILVIDDLANRNHICDILLDQTFGREPKEYTSHVTPSCEMLLGSKYALLRPEFAALREYSLNRRNVPKLEKLLVTLGGVDKDNVTALVLKALDSCQLPENCQVVVVMGAKAPWLDDVKNIINSMKIPVELMVNVKNMAQIMSECDLCIGAAGSTSWERCCLGVPTISMQLAENQQTILSNLEKIKATLVIKNTDSDTVRKELTNILMKITKDVSCLNELIRQASSVTDGKGAERVVQIMERCT